MSTGFKMSTLIKKVVIDVALVIIVALIVWKVFIGKDKVKRKTLIENLGNNVPSLNPHSLDDLPGMRICNDIYEGLVSYNQMGEIELTGATKYEISSDLKTYTFYLNEKAKWTNGDPVVADDYVYSYRRALKSAKSYGDLLYPIKNAKDIKKGNMNETELGVYSDGKYKLTIELEEPNSEFIHYMTLPVFLPVNRKNFAKNKIGFSSVKDIISNGPYKLKKWINNDRIEVEKSDSYWDKDNVHIDKVVFLMITDSTVDLNAFKCGQVDITFYNLPPIESKDYIKEFGNKFKKYSVLAQDKLVFNLKNPKFEDIKVRKALSMALDRDKLNEIVFKDSRPSYLVIPENMQNGKFENDIKNLDSYKWVNNSVEERVMEAQNMLKSIGYSANNKLVIEIYTYTNDQQKKCLETIKDMYESAFEGIVECNLRFDDWATFQDNYHKGDFDIISIGWLADYNLPSNFSMLYTTGNVGNHGFFSEKTYDDLYYKSIMLSPNEYNNFQHLLNAIASSEFITIPYSVRTNRRLVSDRVIGFTPEKNLLDRYRTKDMDIRQ